jgi:hypothetical protein
MSKMCGVFCIKISKDIFNPMVLNKLLESFNTLFTIEKKNIHIEQGMFVCASKMNATENQLINYYHNYLSKDRFKLNYTYFPESENYGISLTRYSGNGYVTAVMMKKVFDELPKYFIDSSI